MRLVQFQMSTIVANATRRHDVASRRLAASVQRYQVISGAELGMGWFHIGAQDTAAPIAPSQLLAAGRDTQCLQQLSTVKAIGPMTVATTGHQVLHTVIIIGNRPGLVDTTGRSDAKYGRRT
jgi:hypothetical protein